MIHKGGRYRNGPQALAIYKYTIGATGLLRWFIAYEPEDLQELLSDPSVTTHELLWQRPRRPSDATRS